MRNGLMIFTIIVMFSLACKEINNDPKFSVLTQLIGESGISYNESLSKWADLKAVNGNSYIYQTSFSSWVGFGNRTELKIVDGKVIERVYEAFDIGVNGDVTILDSYSETLDNLGENENGGMPLTIDELYETCAADYLIVDQKNNTIYFETSEDQMMMLCGFTPIDCIDDCYTGIRISAFEWIQ